jgi:hypothetical protein
MDCVLKHSQFSAVALSSMTNSVQQQLDELIEQSVNKKMYRHQISSLSSDQQARLLNIAKPLHAAGAAEPLSWAWSELSENIAQSARFFILKELWLAADDVEGTLFEVADEPLSKAQKAIDAAEQAIGKEAFRKLLRDYGHSLMDRSISILDDGGHDLPIGWRLMEDVDGVLTGRGIDGLHEDSLEFDQQLREQKHKFDT